MYQVRRIIELDAGHRVPFHNSKCYNVHGHRYRVEAVAGCARTIRYDTKSSSAGMGIDFGDLKCVMMETIHDRYDHKLMLWENDEILATTNHDILMDSIVRLPIVPTAEELAAFWYKELASAMAKAQVEKADRLHLLYVKVWETPNCWATYTPAFGGG